MKPQIQNQKYQNREKKRLGTKIGNYLKLILYQVFLLRSYISNFLALDLLQTMTEVEECGVCGSILVVSENQTSIIMHTLPNKTANKHELFKIDILGNTKDVESQSKRTRILDRALTIEGH